MKDGKLMPKFMAKRLPPNNVKDNIIILSKKE